LDAIERGTSHQRIGHKLFFGIIPQTIQNAAINKCLPRNNHSRQTKPNEREEEY
jgi:hypothetical protein